MESKKTKYDTNPLDPDFVRKTQELGGEGDGGAPTQSVKGATRDMGSSANDEARRSVYSEAPTRAFNEVPLDSPYQSVFVPPTYSQPVPYQPPVAQFHATTQKPTSRTVAGIGLPEKWALMLPYAPFYIGVVVSLLELFLAPKSETRVRFHASQGLSLHVAILVVQTLFGILELVTDSGVGGKLFGLGATIFLIISMIRVWKGEPHHIAPLDEPSKWFNEHIKRHNS